MIVFLSKLLAPALSPVGIACELLVIAIIAVRRGPRLARAAAAAALLVLLVCGNQWFSFALTEYLEERNPPVAHPPHAGAIVVLSSDAEPAIPPQPAIVLDGQTANRLIYGAQLYREGKAPTVIVSGGQMPWLKGLPPMSLAMAEFIELLGVPRSAVIQESNSANTYENALDVKAILQARHIGRILLVTSAMHMPRALALFRHQRIDTVAAPCDFLSLLPYRRTRAQSWQSVAIGLIPGSGDLNLSSLALKELLGMAVYRAAGRL